MPRLSSLVIPSVVLVLASGLGAPNARAQGSGSWEFGLDGSAGVRLFDGEYGRFPYFLDEQFLVNVPVASVRVGPYLSDRFQIEPSVAFDLSHFGDHTVYDADLGLSLLLYFEDDPDKVAPFLRAGGGVLLVDGDSPLASQFRAGGSLGVRIPASDRIAVRLHAGVDRRFDKDYFLGSWDVLGRFGLSFFTR